MGFDSGEPVGDGLLLRFLKREGVVQGAGHHVRQGTQEQHVFVVEGAGLARFDVQHAQQLVAVDDGQAQHRSRVGQHRLDCARVLGTVHLAQGAALRHLANAAFAQLEAPVQPLGAMAGFDLDDHLTGFVIEDAQPDVIVGQPEVKLGGDGGQHLFRVQGGDGAAGNIVEQFQLTGALLLGCE